MESWLMFASPQIDPASVHAYTWMYGCAAHLLDFEDLGRVHVKEGVVHSVG